MTTLCAVVLLLFVTSPGVAASSLVPTVRDGTKNALVDNGKPSDACH